MADCHSGRDGVRVDDDVRSDALTGERHVLQHGKDTPMRGEISKRLLHHQVTPSERVLVGYCT